MSRHSEICQWLKDFAERYPDASMSLGVHAAGIRNLILGHPESQPDPNAEIERLRTVLQHIASSPERYRDSSGDKVGPEWVICDIKQAAAEALLFCGESHPNSELRQHED